MLRFRFKVYDPFAKELCSPSSSRAGSSSARRDDKGESLLLLTSLEKGDLMTDDHRSDDERARADRPAKRADSTSGNEKYGSTKDQKIDPSSPDAEGSS